MTGELEKRLHELLDRYDEFAAQNGGRDAEAFIALFAAPAGMEKPPLADEHLRALSPMTRCWRSY
jgi:hypothetical protein